MRNKLFTIAATFALAYVAAWLGDRVAAFTADVLADPPAFAFVGIVFAIEGMMFGYLYFESLETGSRNSDRPAELTFLVSALLFGICATPFSAHDWGSPWSLVLLVGFTPLYVELRISYQEFLVSQLPPSWHQNVILFRRNP